ncbi:biotin--[acetyl-CoA-carboxylase] ligase [Spirosoma utsteinense]|uniref:biotin--[biotin carboxyl-carrier protein] ligase n=1 Tax=Spirosoma utsteinense TaxID=2585773 RepID=A0ABR6W2B4_9BACT|nr:biotin--[acetyl-CoA-carboxylase] ligase [Spirosoma utsteinense]MBC3786047.1 BirA family biotin operon repressor/biotin-[acetyl-CoA-carboxylase] ligase [Spirosoma utsteinense]MBC3790746.1 BirA family biotin operon repressor/biotin-[acetyl-CoA-carboxylase] ligase [Spirosoma utsteinense]
MYKIYPKTLFAGQIIKYLPSCQSTNDEASDLIAQSEPAEGTIVVTDNQTAGRGQRGNIWLAQAGQNLTFSLILKPVFLPASDQFWLNMAISLGITDTLKPLIGEALRIKWPNDIYAGDQKLGGILIENTLHSYHIAWSVVGMGLNVNQVEFAHPTATSIQQQTPLPNGYDLPGLLSACCEHIEQRYLQLRSGQRKELESSYLQLLYRYQEVHHFKSEDRLFTGKIVGIDPMGRLAIQRGDGVRYFNFKEVAFILMNDE